MSSNATTTGVNAYTGPQGEFPGQSLERVPELEIGDFDLWTVRLAIDLQKLTGHALHSNIDHRMYSQSVSRCCPFLL